MTAPDWPLIEYAVCWSAGPNDTPVQDYWCNLSTRTEGTTTVRRGKQYELDQVQPGEMTLTFRNDDGVFDPTNTTSPFWPQVKPYRLIRLRAQYPATVNLLTAAQAVGPFTGNQSVTGFSVTPGANYAAQCQGQGSGVTGTLALQWYSVTGTLISTTTGTGVALPATGWASVTVTGAAPANAVGAVLTFTQSGGTATTESYQVEQNTTPSTFATPGSWYSLFTGYVERWPQSWSSGGNYGTVAVDCVDLFGFLANAPLNYPAYLELLSLGPTWFLPLDEGPSASAFHDVIGGPSATLTAVLTTPSQTITPGQSLTSTGGWQPLGISGQVASIVVPTGELDAQYIDVTGGGQRTPGPQTSAAWTRIIAFRTPIDTALANTSAMLWLTSPGLNLETSIQITANYDSSGQYGNPLNILWFSNGTNVAALASNASGNLSDGGWHLLIFTATASPAAVSGWLDNVALTSATTGASLALSFVGGQDVIGGTPLIGNGPAGDISFVAELPFVINGAQAANIYQAFRYAWESVTPGAETSGGRYARILNWINYTGPSRLDTGASIDYGPATDITGGSNPTYALQALQNVVTTEYGQHYIAADGTVTFKARTARYNPAPAVSFGEQAGEVPYLNAAMDFDPTRIANQIEVDTQGGNTARFCSDSSSQADYGQIGLQWTANTLDLEELQDGAEYLLYQNKQPLQRLAALPVDVGANPSVFASLLGLDLGAAVTVNRRPSAAPVISQVGYVEQIQWTIGEDRSCQWSAQVSNALAHYFGALDSTAYGRLGADGNTLNAAITSTATSLAIATAAGKAVFSNSASDYPMNILVDAEQITLTAAPGGLTSPQTFTVTRGANGTTPAAHSVGAVMSVVGSLVFGF